jgi:hypothetical protein
MLARRGQFRNIFTSATEHLYAGSLPAVNFSRPSGNETFF